MKFLTKLLLKVLLTLFILVFVFVGIPLILLQKQATPPYDQYVVSADETFYEHLDQELLDLMTDDQKDVISFTMDEAFINRSIQKMLSKSNPKYQNPTYADELDYRYMMTISGQIGFKGVWTTLEDDSIKIILAADYIFMGNAIYSTAMFVDLNIVLNGDNGYYLQIEKIQLGKLNLPLDLALSITNFFVESFQNKSLEDLVAESIPFGVFNQEEVSITVDEEALTDYLYTIDPSFSALLRVIYDEQLLTMDFSSNGFDVALNLGIFRRLPTDLNEPVFAPLEDDADKAQVMTSIATRAATDAILNPTDPKIRLTEAELNQILDYQLQDSVKFEFPLEFMLNGVEQKYIFKSSILFVRMVNDVLSVHLKMTLEKEGVIDTFDMQFNLFTSVSINQDGDMILDVISSHMGDVNLDSDILKMMFDTFDSSLMQGSQIVVKKESLNEMFQGSGLVFDQAEVDGDELVMHFGFE